MTKMTIDKILLILREMHMGMGAVAYHHMCRILERCNNNQVMPSLGKPHEYSYEPKLGLELSEMECISLNYRRTM